MGDKSPKAKDKAIRSQCMSNLHQMGIALFNYGSDNGNNNKLPDWLRKFLEQHGKGEQAPPADGDPGAGKTPGDAASNGDGQDGGSDGGDEGQAGNEQSLGSGFILSCQAVYQ